MNSPRRHSPRRRSPPRPRALVALGAALLATTACRDTSNFIEGVGTIEYTEVSVAPLVTARVVTLRVDEGDAVRAGQTLATLTNAVTPTEVAARQAQLRQAEELLRDLQAGARAPELSQAQAEVRAAEAEAEVATTAADRARRLHAAGAASTQELEIAVTRATTAGQRVEALRSALRLLQEGSRPARIQAARSEVDAARAALDAARRSADELTVESPVDGTVAVRVANPGDVVPAGSPVVTVARTDSLWVRIYLNQEHFARVQVGDSASARLDPFPDRRFSGHVIALASRAEFTPRVALTERERADLLFGVKVLLQDTTGLLKAGLPVTVRIHP